MISEKENSLMSLKGRCKQKIISEHKDKSTDIIKFEGKKEKIINS